MKAVPLGEAFLRITNGKNVRQDDSGEGLPVTRIETIANGRVNPLKCGYAALPRAGNEKWILHAGDILISHINSPKHVGKCAIYEAGHPEMIHGMNLLRLEPDVTQLDSRYAFHQLRSPKFRADLRRFINQAVNQASVSISNLKSIDFMLPPLDEQRRIAAILDKADELRTKRREALDHLDTLIQSIFHSMFGSGIPAQSEYPVVKVGDVLRSATYGSSEKAATSGDMPILRMGNLTYSGELDMRDLKYVRANQPDKYLLRCGDVLFNRTNSADLVGKTAMYKGSEPLAYAGYLIRLRSSPELLPEYLTAFMNLPSTKALLRNMAKSIVGMANINAKEVQSIRLPLPPLELQRAFAIRVAAVERLKEMHRKHLAELDALFSSLQHRAFKGEL